MATFSHSRLQTFENCPLQYKYRYVDRIRKDVEGVEGFLGKCCHKTLEKLYRDLKMTKLDSLGDLITFFNDFWEKNWSDSRIQIVKPDYTQDNYRNLGERCLRDYYKRYSPFERGVTLGLEERITIPLSENGKYRMVGYIDRLTQAADGVYEIHDYKTSGFPPTQKMVDTDRQLALYQLSVKNKWPDAREIGLVWHFLAFDKEMVSHRNDEQLEGLKRQTISLIDKIEATREFLPVESNLCYWCEYQEICPLKKHPSKIDSMPVNKYLNEEGVILISKFAELRNRKQQLINKLDRELAELEEAIIQYAQKEDVEVIKGIDHKLRVKTEEKAKVPPKGDPARDKLERLIKESDKWMEVSDLNLSTLSKVVKDRSWDENLLAKLKEYAVLEKRYRIYLSRIMDDERVYEMRDR